jgi:hypothetical protein
MIDHRTVGRSVQNYLILTEFPELLEGLALSASELFWSRYYWLARFAREWQAVSGFDAGLEQQVFQLLEFAEHRGIEFDPLPDLETAVERDAVVSL